jgi:hypothetical protein
MKAWHFVGAKLRDGRPVPKDGVKLVHPGPPKICQSGLHASLRPWDALQYAPGSTLCLVECGGTVRHQADKLVCTERTILVRMDATLLLREFARMQALSLVHLWEPPAVVLDYLMGDDAARDAARDAAWDAAMDAAGEAAWDAAREAAREAAWEAALEAAWAAARAAAWEAARAAARAAAWEAAWAAAGDAFDHMVHDAFEDWL